MDSATRGAGSGDRVAGRRGDRLSSPGRDDRRVESRDLALDSHELDTGVVGSGAMSDAGKGRAHMTGPGMWCWCLDRLTEAEQEARGGRSVLEAMGEPAEVAREAYSAVGQHEEAR